SSACLACLWSLWYLFRSLKARKGKNGLLGLPPGPMGLPLLGHLHMLGDHPHRNLQKMAEKYGPIMFLKLGVVPTVVVSSPEWAELFLKIHDTNFASRPQMQALKFMSYGQKNLAFAQYGPYWRNIRKLCTIELLNSSKVESFRPMRREVLSNFIKSIVHTGKLGGPINVSAMVESLIQEMTYRMIFGSKNDRFDFKAALQEGLKLVGVFNLADYIPYIGALDLQGLGRRMKAISKVLDGYLEKIIDEHEHDAKKLKGQHRDFIDVMLSLMKSNNNTRELHIERDNIKAIVLDIFAAAMDSSSIAIVWAISELQKHPRVMKLVQEELERVVGLERMVEETDLDKLCYLKLVVMESLRLHPAPILVPHESIEDITLNGYFIPKKSTVIINNWAIGRDPNAWSSNSEEFHPERFIGTDIDIQGHNFQYLPFGSGRRKCPGMNLGMTVVQLVLAQMIHCFNLELPDGMSPDNLDMTETFGIAMPKTKHLMAIPTYRLCINLPLDV
ncbi:hypothetical protein AQUCO_01200271v1, partial [Aquilegia coerulea]